MSGRERRVDRLVAAMTWPPSEELDLLDAELQMEIAQLAATMMTAAARVRSLLRPLLPEVRTVQLTAPGTSLDPRPSAELSRFRPGDYLDGLELTLPELREIAATNPLAHWLGPLLDDTLPRLEEAVSDLVVATRRYRLDQREELREFLRCLPNALLDRLAELAPGWDDDLEERRAALRRLERRLAETLRERPAAGAGPAEELRPERLGERAEEPSRPASSEAALRPERLGESARDRRPPAPDTALRPERLGESARAPSRPASSEEALRPERLGDRPPDSAEPSGS